MTPLLPGTFNYPLVIGLPHTNYNGFSEPQLFMQAGHFQWNSIAESFGKPMSSLKTSGGQPIYATYYYVELELPPMRPLRSFRLDQSLLFINRLRHYKGVAIDGLMLFDEADRWTAERLQQASAPEALRGHVPFMRLCNVFISPTGNENLKIVPPESVPFDHLQSLPPEDHAYPLVREASHTKTFGSFGPEWSPLDRSPDYSMIYRLNPDRDTNGAGLVYFANYIHFMEQAERMALKENSVVSFTGDQIDSRSVIKRRIAYFGNAAITDSLRLKTELFKKKADELGVRTLIFRHSDDKLIALSEAQKSL